MVRHDHPDATGPGAGDRGLAITSLGALAVGAVGNIGNAQYSDRLSQYSGEMSYARPISPLYIMGTQVPMVGRQAQERLGRKATTMWEVNKKA